MAFFKFRWPGQKQQEGKAGNASRPAKAESIEAMRRRARHRLMGAAVLIVLGVLGFPMLFDTQPRPIPVDTPIEIPDRNKVAPLVVPADVPHTADAALPRVAGSLDEGEELVAARSAPSKAPAPAFVPQPAPQPAVAAKAELKPETKPEARTQAKPEPKPEAKAAPRPAPAEPAAKPEPVKPSRPEISSSEAARARALLEGRTVPPVSVATATPSDALTQEGRFVVQVGAFADAAAAQEVKEKLERAGFKAFTQAVTTSEGKRTRVRVGPLQGRSDADKAAARIKGMGLAASVQKL